MKTLLHIGIIFGVGVLAACTHAGTGGQAGSSALTQTSVPIDTLVPQKSVGVTAANQDISVFSNTNVIVYPLDGSAPVKDFPKAKGVWGNATAGGYTVFDPSVEVFSVDGANHRPDYMPDYAVPTYGTTIAKPGLTPMPAAVAVDAMPAAPIDMAPNAVVAQPLQPQKPALNIDKNPGRRSERLLTEYK